MLLANFSVSTFKPRIGETPLSRGERSGDRKLCGAHFSLVLSVADQEHRVANLANIK